MKADIDKLMAEKQGCDCPVSAALNSIKEEAEAADLYNKRSFTVEDEHSREVYRDIAKEEMVHLGEAAELLRENDPELAQKVVEGMDEAKGVGQDEKWKPDIDKEIEDRQK
jgi:rubrerythrin